MTTADGLVETRADGSAVISFERRLAHPPDRVWSAITDPAQVIRWWGELNAELQPGGDFELRWLNEDEEARSVGWRGTLTEYEPPRVVETTGVCGDEGGVGRRGLGVVREQRHAPLRAQSRRRRHAPALHQHAREDARGVPH